MSLTWSQLHNLIGAVSTEESDLIFSGINSLDEASASEVSFLGNTRYLPQLEETKSLAVLVPEGEFKAPVGCHLITVENPSTAFSKLIDHFHQETISFEPGISPGAHVAEGVSLDPTQVQVAAGAVIESGAKIGSGTAIGAGCLVGRDVTVGENCLLHAGSVIRERCRLGNRVILQPNCVIGSDGYGFELVDGRQQKIPQIGIVEIHDDVEIGSNTTIDRARFGKTVIGEGSKIDNLVQIAHNVKVGKHCLLVSQCGVAGSSKIGDSVTIAAQAGIAGHLEIGDHVVVVARGGVLKNLPKAGVYMGLPARPMRAEQRKQALMARLPKMQAEFKELKNKIAELSAE